MCTSDEVRLTGAGYSAEGEPHLDRSALAQVREKARRLWPDADTEEVMAELAPCGGVRVQLAALKVSGGDRERLAEAVRAAQADWRDVIAAAEYPEQSRMSGRAWGELSRREQAAVRRRDRAQYRAWLRR